MSSQSKDFDMFVVRMCGCGGFRRVKSVGYTMPLFGGDIRESSVVHTNVCDHCGRVYTNKAKKSEAIAFINRHCVK